MPDVSPLLTAGLNVAGGLIGGLFQSGENQSNWREQAEYNSPANQMKRLTDAGLNPNLVYGQGTPGNAPAPPQNANFQDSTKDFGTVLQQAKVNAVEIQKNQQTVENLKEQVAMMKDNQELIKANTELRDAQTNSTDNFKNPNLASSTALNLSIPGYHDALANAANMNASSRASLVPFEQQRMESQSNLAGSNIALNDVRSKQLMQLTKLDFSRTANEMLQNQKLSQEMPFVTKTIGATLDVLNSRALLNQAEWNTQGTMQALNKATTIMRYFQDGKITTSGLKDLTDILQKFVGGGTAAGMLGKFGL